MAPQQEYLKIYDTFRISFFVDLLRNIKQLIVRTKAPKVLATISTQTRQKLSPLCPPPLGRRPDTWISGHYCLFVYVTRMALNCGLWVVPAVVAVRVRLVGETVDLS